ncbi:uncharacterized protein LOC135385720 [Ornithodoros turicata]|uniref:uncharacterized protein LOC135385720 n=1 Tax=Ornithodoros turicata TaxID=34597 RepID=UPI00313A1C4B
MRYFPEVMAGFRQGRSSIDSVIDIVPSVQQARSEGQLTAAVFLDVMKAYDSVVHSAVIATLQESAAGARVISWHIKALSTTTKKFVNVLRRISGASWGPSCNDLRHVHNVLVLGLLRYHFPASHGFSTTETRETPVLILRDRETLRIFARFLTQQPCHYPLSIEDARPASAFGGAVRRLKAILPDRSSSVSYAPPLWALDKPQVLTSVSRLGRKRETPIADARQLVLEHLPAQHQQRQAIYTDGSVTPDGATAAIYVPHGNIEQAFSLCLSHTTSSTEAELFAIHAALRHITTSPPGTWTILSDSKAALETLDSHCTKTSDDLHTMITSIANTALASGHDICLQCISSHIGLGGNDRADAAARRAHEQPDAAAHIPLTPSACRIQIRRWAAQEARCFIHESALFNELLRAIDPAVEFSPPRRLQRLHRLRLKLAYTPPVQRMMGRQISAPCDVCEVVADTSHVLLTCPKYTTHCATLSRYLQRFGHNQLTLAALLGPVPQHQ